MKFSPYILFAIFGLGVILYLGFGLFHSIGLAWHNSMTAFIEAREGAIEWKSEAKDKAEQASAEEQLLRFDKVIVLHGEKKPRWINFTKEELEEINKAKFDLAHPSN